MMLVLYIWGGYTNIGPSETSETCCMIDMAWSAAGPDSVSTLHSVTTGDINSNVNVECYSLQLDIDGLVILLIKGVKTQIHIVQ